MTKKEMLEWLVDVADDAVISVCIADEAENLDDLEPGSLLDIKDSGFVAGQHVLYVNPR